MQLHIFKSMVVLLVALLILTPKGYAMSVAPKSNPKTPPAPVEVVLETTKIILACPSNLANAAAMCDALKSALQQRAPNHKIQLGNRAPAQKELAITLHITKANNHLIEGYLEWKTGSTNSRKGPPITLGVNDTTLKPQMFDSFASGLVKVSQLPIH